MSDLQKYFSNFSAADAAELLCSAHIPTKLLQEICHDEGIFHWLINRSDVYTEILQILKEHPLENFAKRCQEKINIRSLKPKIAPLPSFDLHENEFDKLDTYDIECALGHPFCPLKIIYFFMQNPQEDMRLSAVLALTRRYFESHLSPSEIQDIQIKISTHYITELSPIVRSYLARLPLVSETQLNDFFEREEHPLVQARLLQNPASSKELLNKKIAELCKTSPLNSHLEFTLSAGLLDSRLNSDLLKKASKDFELAKVILFQKN